MEKLLYAVTEAAEATGLGRSKLYQLMADGKIESVKCGKRRLIPRDALEAFVAQLRQEATDDAA